MTKHDYVSPNELFYSLKIGAMIGQVQRPQLQMAIEFLNYKSGFRVTKVAEARTGPHLSSGSRRSLMTAPTQTVREIALEVPSSIRVFEQFGIDYCCGGRKPLAEACEAGNIEVDAVIAALDAAAGKTLPNFKDWTAASLESLSAHIVATHHSYVKAELPRLAVLAEKVVNRHGATQAELPAIQKLLANLDAELTQHLAKEEAILFPYVSALENAVKSGTELPHGCFGTVANPIAMMTQEHDAAGSLIAEIHGLSNQFTTPESACPTYHAFYDGLRDFEKDLHQHIHLENNILFPRAIALEAIAAVSPISRKKFSIFTSAASPYGVEAL